MLYRLMTRLSPYAAGGMPVLVVFGLLLGYMVGHDRATTHYESLFSSVSPIRATGDTYVFTRPLLAYAFPEASDFGQFNEMADTLKRTITEAQDADSIFRASIYFRDLEHSGRLGINEEETYHPASLLKVPVLIAYYREAEQNPFLLDTKLIFDPALFPNVPFGVPFMLVPGQAYPVRDLLGHMIKDSDNGATFALLSRLDPRFLQEVYQALGIPEPDEDSLRYQISTRTYALFFRILYNATYLSPEYSERALKFLSETSYDRGLVAGVPKGTVVAHKFGEHVMAEGGKAQGVELHDCGIVYYEPRPYLLCVMTSAPKLDVAEEFIRTVSAIVFSAMKAQFPTAAS